MYDASANQIAQFAFAFYMVCQQNFTNRQLYALEWLQDLNGDERFWTVKKLKPSEQIKDGISTIKHNISR